MDYTIRQVKVDDVEVLQAISRETFKQTFDPFTSAEDMLAFLRDDYETDKLLKEINDPNSYFYFLIVSDEIAGYLKVNEGNAQTENVRHNALEVERIYLRAKFQHQGLGLILIQLAEQIALNKGKKYLWLGVYEKNQNAQRFYAKDGFKRVGQHVFQVGADPQIDYILVKKLS